MPAIMAQTGQGKLTEADETYQKMATISARGAEMATMGQADLLLYQGRTKDAIALLERASNQSAKMDDSTRASHALLLAEAKLAAGKFVSFVEILPPRGIDASREIAGAKLCAEHGIDAINVPEWRSQVLLHPGECD